MEQPSAQTARDRRGRRRSSSRRWCIPPAIVREPNETLEGSQILDENPADVALVLWNSLRDATLWSSVQPDRREGLFSAAAAAKRRDQLQNARVDPTLEVALTALAAVVSSPATASPDIVSLVCVQVSRWAQEHGRMGTALAFAQAAALASPGDARAACAVGHLALGWGRHARAETWLRRGIGLARRARDWQTYAEGYVDLGLLYAQRQIPVNARLYYTTAVRAARRHGLLPTRGAALHGLFLLAVDAGDDLPEAERIARAAMRAYGRGHPRLPDLLHDLACLWVGQERYGRAIPVLQRLLVTRTEPAARALTLAMLARAAAGTGERRLYEEAWNTAWYILDGLAGPDECARAVLELARAAARLNDWVRVEQAIRLHARQPPQSADPRILDELAKLATSARSRGGS